jgi:uncharacterized protein YkwD
MVHKIFWGLLISVFLIIPIFFPLSLPDAGTPESAGICAASETETARSSPTAVPAVEPLVVEGATMVQTNEQKPEKTTSAAPPTAKASPSPSPSLKAAKRVTVVSSQTEAKVTAVTTTTAQVTETARQTTMPPPTPTPTPSSAPAQSDSIPAILFACTNQFREKNGLSPLIDNASLDQAAQLRAREVAACPSHQRPDGRAFYTILSDSNLSFRISAENFACATTGAYTAENIFACWLASAAHQANILGTNYTQIGIGFAIHEDTAYYVQLFVG